MENISFQWEEGKCFPWEEFYQCKLPPHPIEIFDHAIKVTVGTVGPTPKVAMETVHRFQTSAEAFEFGVAVVKTAEDWRILPDGSVWILWVGDWA